MAKKQHIVRTAFSDLQFEDVSMLMQDRRMDTPQELIRVLVSDAAREARENQMRYGRKSAADAVPRETAPEKQRRLMTMPIEELNTILTTVLREDFGKGEGDSIYAYEDEMTGQRMLRIMTPSTGEDNKVLIEPYIRQWMKEKRI